MDLVISTWAFKLLVICTIIILLIASAVVLSKKEISLFKRVSLLVLTWVLPILGGISAILILLKPAKNDLKIV